MTLAIPKPDQQPERIRSMFGEIARRYDVINRIMTGGIDILWRKKTVRMALTGRETMVLDLACGTGDLALELLKNVGPNCKIIGADFTPEMLEIARKKTPAGAEGRLEWMEADGMNLPFADNTFDLLTIGFGIRNMSSLEGALREMARVLKPGGRVAILECSTPQNWFVKAVYMPYFLHVLPRIGAMLSQKSAYLYLPHSAVHFPLPKPLADTMERCGFVKARWKLLFMGAAAIHVAEKKS